MDVGKNALFGGVRVRVKTPIHGTGNKTTHKIV